MSTIKKNQFRRPGSDSDGISCRNGRVHFPITHSATSECLVAFTSTPIPALLTQPHMYSHTDPNKSQVNNQIALTFPTAVETVDQPDLPGSNVLTLDLPGYSHTDLILVISKTITEQKHLQTTVTHQVNQPGETDPDRAGRTIFTRSWILDSIIIIICEGCPALSSSSFLLQLHLLQDIPLLCLGLLQLQAG